jgi:hypothetical protein
MRAKTPSIYYDAKEMVEELKSAQVSIPKYIHEWFSEMKKMSGCTLTEERGIRKNILPL